MSTSRCVKRCRVTPRCHVTSRRQVTFRRVSDSLDVDDVEPDGEGEEVAVEARGATAAGRAAEAKVIAVPAQPTEHERFDSKLHCCGPQACSTPDASCCGDCVVDIKRCGH